MYTDLYLHAKHHKKRTMPRTTMLRGVGNVNQQYVGYSAMIFNDHPLHQGVGAKSHVTRALCRITVVGDGTFHCADPIFSHLILLESEDHGVTELFQLVELPGQPGKLDRFQSTQH